MCFLGLFVSLLVCSCGLFVLLSFCRGFAGLRFFFFFLLFFFFFVLFGCRLCLSFFVCGCGLVGWFTCLFVFCFFVVLFFIVSCFFLFLILVGVFFWGFG